VYTGAGLRSPPFLSRPRRGERSSGNPLGLAPLKQADSRPPASPRCLSSSALSFPAASSSVFGRAMCPPEAVVGEGLPPAAGTGLTPAFPAIPRRALRARRGPLAAQKPTRPLLQRMTTSLPLVIGRLVRLEASLRLGGFLVGSTARLPRDHRRRRAYLFRGATAVLARTSGGLDVPDCAAAHRSMGDFQRRLGSGRRDLPRPLMAALLGAAAMAPPRQSACRSERVMSLFTIVVRREFIGKVLADPIGKEESAAPADGSVDGRRSSLTPTCATDAPANYNARRAARRSL
jgi:hypothetical protein